MASSCIRPFEPLLPEALVFHAYTMTHLAWDVIIVFKVHSKGNTVGSRKKTELFGYRVSKACGPVVPRPWGRLYSSFPNTAKCILAEKKGFLYCTV